MTRSEKATEGFSARISTGLAALEEGAQINAPIHYMSASLGEGMIRHFPDGTRQRLVRVDGELAVAETLAPGVAIVPR